MFCPKCGKGEQTPNGYCRNCGEFLPDIDKLARLGKRRGFGGSTPEENIKTTIYLSLLSTVFAFFAVATLYAIYNGFPVSPGIVAAAAAFSVCIACYQISNVIVAVKLRKRLVRRRDSAHDPHQLNTAALNNLPPAETSQIVHSVTSITENTTSLLEPVSAKNTQKFDG